MRHIRKLGPLHQFLVVLAALANFQLAHAFPMPSENPILQIPSQRPETPPAAVDLEDLVKTCREQLGPYCIYNNCTTHAACIHNMCDVLKMDCKTITYKCVSGRNHALNFILDPETGLWYLVDATGGKVNRTQIFTDPKFLTLQDLCYAQRISAEDCKKCTLEVFNDPYPINTSPSFCARNTGGARANGPAAYKEACQKCCNDRAADPNYKNDPLTPAWLKDCLGACDNYVDETNFRISWD